MSSQECTQVRRQDALAESSGSATPESPPSLPPASLRVFRFHSDQPIQPVIGSENDVPPGDLAVHAAEALRNRTFIFYTVTAHADAGTEELCFVPRDNHCDILSIRTHGWHRRGADARRSLRGNLTYAA